MKTSIILSLCLLVSSILSSQVYFDYLGAGHANGITVTSSDQMGRAEDVNTINGKGMDSKRMEASRFLAHATMGFDMDLINEVADQDFETWIDDQFNIPKKDVNELLDSIWQDVVELRVSQGDDPDNFPWPRMQHFNYTWWRLNMTSPDLLRQKIAYSLSQILVISLESNLIGRAESVGAYYDMLLENSFGNYRDLLFDVSMHPAMGRYLSHLNNEKEDIQNNKYPDENYAREVMQLFSIGLNQLNIDGSVILDFDGNPIPTYNNETIKELAKVFTGLGPGALNHKITHLNAPFFGLGYYALDARVPMLMYDNFHDPREKELLNGYVIPAGQSGMKDVNDAIDHLFNHPNVGPFLAIRMIQRLVKSNPSPSYIARVAQIFNDNGNGVRGDMKAFIKAILLDSEARGASAMWSPSSGRLKEPIVRYLQVAKSMPLDNPNDRYRNEGRTYQRTLRQFPLSANTVFNFYSPDFTPIGQIQENSLVAPEFKILDSYSSTQYLNRVNTWSVAQRQWVSSETSNYGDPAVYMVTDDIEPMASNPEELLNYFDILYCHGQLSDRTRRLIRKLAMQYGAPTNTYNRTRLMMYLIHISPDFVIMK